MRLIKSAHSVYKTQYHIAWATRFRHDFMNPGVTSYLRIKLKEVRAHYPDWGYIEIGTATDHVHLYMIIPPKYAVAKAIETIKTNTSRALKAYFPSLRKLYWDGGGIWSVGYFVSTVGINEAIIKRYVQLQGKEDIGQAKLELP